MKPFSDALLTAKRCGILTARDNETGRRDARAYFRWCEEGALPYVRLTPRTTWADVMLDMGPTGERLTPAAVEQVRALLEAELAQQETRERGYLVYGPNSAGCRCRLERAEGLAAALLAVALGDLLKQSETALAEADDAR